MPLPLIATCTKCTAPFVAREAEHEGSPVARAPLSRCEECRREALERSLEKSREWVKGTGLIAIVFLFCTVGSLQQAKRHDDLQWAGHLVVFVISTLLACFFYFRRLRPQLRQYEVGEQFDLLTGSTAETRRWRRLEELGALDWKKEERVSRKRRESTLELLVAHDLASEDELREHRRSSRLLDEIADVDRRLDQLEAGGGASRPPFPADLERLRIRRTTLCQELERPPIWPRVLRGLLARGFVRLLWLPVTIIVWRIFTFCCEAGNPLGIAVSGVCLFGPLVFLVARMWFDRPRPALVGCAGKPAHEAGD